MIACGPVWPDMALAARDNLHSRLVSWAKIILPLTALALLSTLFLVPGRTTIEDAIPYAQVDIEDRLREPRLTGAVFSGMTEDGAALTLQAGDARPGVPGTQDAGLARQLSGQLETPDGVSTTLTAAEARLDAESGVVLLSGGVTVTLSTGYTLGFLAANVALDRTLITATGGINASGPMGQVLAGEFEMKPAEGSAQHYVMVFKGGVRLIYLPAQE